MDREKKEDPSKAPEVPNNRCKILWCPEGTANYETLVSPVLRSILTSWSPLDITQSCLSVILQTVYSSMTNAAKRTNKYIDSSKQSRAKKSIVPAKVKEVRVSNRRAHNHLKKILSSSLSSPTKYFKLEKHLL